MTAALRTARGERPCGVRQTAHRALDVPIGSLRDVPGHWDVVPFRALARERDERGTPDGVLLSVTQQRGIIRQADSENRRDTSSVDKSQYKVVRRGDLVYNKMRAWQGAVGLATEDGIVSPAYVVMRLQGGVDPRYYYHLLKSAPYVGQCARFSYGLCDDMNSLRFNDFRQIAALLPPLEEQRAIANYLDERLKVIDDLLARSRRLKDLLEEHWTLTVLTAVTRGIEQQVTLKESGVPAIGTVPRHWQVLRLKYLWRVIDCKHRTATYVNEGYPLVSTSEVKPGVLSLEGARQTTYDDFLDLTEGRAPQRGDIIYSRNASVGTAAYVDTDVKFCMGQDVCMITSSHQSQRFLAYQLNSGAVLTQLEAAMLGTTIRRINVAQIKSFRVAVPPAEEQRSIAAFLDDVSTRHRAATMRIETHVERLQEYRQAVLTAAVTGQLPGANT